MLAFEDSLLGQIVLSLLCLVIQYLTEDLYAVEQWFLLGFDDTYCRSICLNLGMLEIISL